MFGVEDIKGTRLRRPDSVYIVQYIVLSRYVAGFPSINICTYQTNFLIELTYNSLKTIVFGFMLMIIMLKIIDTHWFKLQTRIIDCKKTICNLPSIVLICNLGVGSIFVQAC